MKPAPAELTTPSFWRYSIGLDTVKTGSQPRSQLEVEAFVHSDNGDGRKKLQRYERYINKLS